MTIKEIEQALGMPRANIRYYEQEGLIAPGRLENGYRDYSLEDVRTLEKVSLLRALDCSVAQIRDIKEGRETLEDVMREKSRDFSAVRQRAEESIAICDAIRESGEGFAQLDAKKYLSGAWREQAAPIAPPKETLPRVSLWRRYWARMLDWQIYTCFWTIFLSFALPPLQRSDGMLWTILGILIGDMVMLGLEPLLLHFFGTTPGKWALGLRVCAQGGGKLTLDQARERTKGVLWHGLCMNLPVIELRFQWKRYRDAEDGTPLYWEDESYIVQRGVGARRVPLYLGLRGALATMIVFCMGLGLVPPHRGALTAEEFAENYNDVIWNYGTGLSRIDAQGNEIEEPGVMRVVMGTDPVLEIIEQEGVVQEVRLSVQAEAGEDGSMLFVPRLQMGLSAVSLCVAESPLYREMWVFGSDAMRILKFCDALDPTGRDASAEELGGVTLYAFAEDEPDGSTVSGDVMELGGWVLEYAAKSKGGVYPTSDGSAVILPEGEGGSFEAVFSARRK